MIHKDSFYFFMLLLSYVFGNVFYYIHQFSYIDELLIGIILFCYLYYVYYKSIRVDNKVKSVVCFVLFYIIYSIAIHVTNVGAVLRDALQESKPLIAFFVIYALKPSLHGIHKFILSVVSLSLGLFSFLLFFFSGSEYFVHNAFYGHVMLISSVIYLVCSGRKREDFIIFFILLSMGLLSARSKYYGEFAVALMLVPFLKPPIKLNFKYAVLGMIVICVVVWAAWEKFNIYFVEGLENDSIARNALYVTSVQVLKDYFPLGSGLGTFGVDATKVYYSPLYYKYGLNSIWGLSENYDSYIADTYFPVIIAQFGIVGLFLFYKFVRFVIVKSNRSYINGQRPIYLVILLILSTLIIESIAGPMFVMTTGVTLLMLLAYCICEIEQTASMTRRKILIELVKAIIGKKKTNVI